MNFFSKNIDGIRAYYHGLLLFYEAFLLAILIFFSVTKAKIL